MSTFMAQPNAIERKWYVIDAANKPLGKVAVEAANILRGKHRPEFTPHVDCGEFVIIINAAKAVLTGKKMEQKYYHHHSGYIGGLKSIQYKTLMATRPEMAVELAVKGMLPHNKLGDKAILTGNKMTDKYYHHHSGYIGGLKSVQYKTLMAEKPELAMELAIKGMLPHNSIGAKSFTRLKVFAGAEHNHAAQKPVAVEIN